MIQEILIFTMIVMCFLMVATRSSPAVTIANDALATIQNISAEKGDVIVLRVTTKINAEQMAAIHNYFEKYFSGNGVKLMILSEGIELAGSIQFEPNHSACQRYGGNDSPLSDPEINANSN